MSTILTQCNGSEVHVYSLIEEAEGTANKPWDVDFVEDIRGKFDKYGMDMYLSDAQYDQLRRIGED